MGKNRPELGKKFFDYYNAVFADGALTAREKSLIALAVAHAVQCPYCIDAYTQDALAEGRRPRADDRGRARGRRHPRRRVPRPRRADARTYAEKAGDVSAPRPPARSSRSLARGHAPLPRRRRAAARSARSGSPLAREFDGGARATRASRPLAARATRRPPGQRRQALQPDLPPLPRGRGPGPPRGDEPRDDGARASRALARGREIPTVDITGGAPELNPHFRCLVERAARPRAGT